MIWFWWPCPLGTIVVAVVVSLFYSTLDFYNLQSIHTQFRKLGGMGGLESVIKFHTFILLTCEESVRIRLICEDLVRFLYPATKVWRGIMLYPSVSVRLSVRPSVRPHHFRSITWVFIHGFFSNFAYILLSAMSGMGLLMGKIRRFLTELLPFFVLEKWFLACYSFTVHDIWMKLHRYVAHQRLHIVTKDRHSDLPSLWVICPW